MGKTEEEELAEVLEIIKKCPCVNEIALFGSRSRGDNRPDSDWDIMVFLDPDCECSEKWAEKVFETPNKFDIKLVDDREGYGDLILVWDRHPMMEEGTYISADILKDMKALWVKED